jgi:hypothetical protein
MKLSRILEIKMSGDDVKFLQKMLKEYSFYNENIDGYFSQNTLVSVFNFQRQVGIKADGIVGMQTWSQLVNYLNKPIENKINEDIPFKISYINESGLKIYDSLLPENEYNNENTKKEYICLDITSGSSRPDWTIMGWEKDTIEKDGILIPVVKAAHYVIGRKSSSINDVIWDGKIIRSFDDKFWSEYLDTEDEEINKKSIIVSLCNYGNLNIGRDGKFYNLINKPVSESDVIEINYMGYNYWEKITEQQIESLRSLILNLSHKWDINIKESYTVDWFEKSTDTNLKTHTHFNRNKIGLFPQKEVIEMLNSL